MAGEVLIRPATPDDLPAVRALLVETWHDTYDALLGAERVTEITDAWHSVESVARQLDVPDTSFLVAEEDGEIVGHAFASAQKPPVLAIARLYVRPDRQRRGIGASLIASAMARHRESEIMRLDVEAENVKGLSFYRREGFHEIGRSVTAGIDHIAMEKRLTRGA
jgi:ribosomal protein S18 acetylase RimI-like enzyme